jgi:hypothetical protein
MGREERIKIIYVFLFRSTSWLHTNEIGELSRRGMGISNDFLQMEAC